MGDDGGAASSGGGFAHIDMGAGHSAPAPSNLPQVQPAKEPVPTPLSPTNEKAPDVFHRRNTSLDLDDYFVGPRDLGKHSKWPMFMQMHGSIVPKLIFPLLVVGAWATCITCISTFSGVRLVVNSVLLTVLGFVVALGLSFRSATAYERYAEGRKYWAQLILATQVLGRIYWVHGKEREGELKKKDVLAKLSALNLLVAFAVALKHRLRFEPYTNYEDLARLVGHLDTLAGAATAEDPSKHTVKPGKLKSFGQLLGLSFATSNPRKAVKKAQRPIGNLPLEILSYLGAYTDELIANGQLPIASQQTLAYNNIAVLNDVLVGTERVLNTPLPIAYAITIAQITWVYVFLLPFQLFALLSWVTIPATMAAAYIILGILFIGREIENPFGHDVNDLPLESFCAQIATELDIMASRPKPTISAWVEKEENRVLFPLSNSGYPVWLQRSEEQVRAALIAKTELGYESKKAAEPEKKAASPETV